MKKKKTATQAFIEQDKKEMAKKKARSSRMFNPLFNVPPRKNGGVNW